MRWSRPCADFFPKAHREHLQQPVDVTHKVRVVSEHAESAAPRLRFGYTHFSGSISGTTLTVTSTTAG